MKPCSYFCGAHHRLKHWKARVVMMSTLSSLMAPDVVIMTTSGAISDGKVGIIMIMTILRFEWVIWCKLSDVSSAFCVHTPCRFKLSESCASAVGETVRVDATSMSHRIQQRAWILPDQKTLRSKRALVTVTRQRWWVGVGCDLSLKAGVKWTPWSTPFGATPSNLTWHFINGTHLLTPSCKSLSMFNICLLTQCVNVAHSVLIKVLSIDLSVAQIVLIKTFRKNRVTVLLSPVRSHY